MSDADWDADDFEPTLSIKPTSSGKWEGEDEEENVKDNWDDEDDEQKESSKSEVAAVQTKKKKSLKEKIAEKEEQKKKEFEQKLEKKRQEDERKAMTPKQVMEEKLRRQKIQEQADLELALEALGLDKNAVNAGEIDLFEPQTKEDFDKFASLLAGKILKYEKSPNYSLFLENLFRDLVLGLESENIKKLSSSLSALYNEKLKLMKTKSKKKTKKATLNIGKEDDNVNNNDEIYEDYDDFM